MSVIVKRCPICKKYRQDDVDHFQKNMGYPVCNCKIERPKVSPAPQKPLKK